MDLTDLLTSLTKRANPPRWGIRTAYDYLASIGGCMSDGYCANTIGKLATPDGWAKALEDAKGRLCYSDDDTSAFDVGKSSVSIAGKEYEIKQSDKSILDFACVITSSKRDRDFDVLETKGARVDTKMPLLWQHIPFEPVGKLVRTLAHTDTRLYGQGAIADTEMGRDAAKLVEMGALRISHGFRPEEWEPLDEKDGMGWRIHKFEIIEFSLVSIPSNVEAIITAVSREKLHHPLVKAWAQKYFDERPVQVASGFKAPILIQRQDGSVGVGVVVDTDLERAKNGEACECKSAEKSHGHYIKRCSCGAVISQCRCMSKDKEETVEVDGCNTCKERKATKADVKMCMTKDCKEPAMYCKSCAGKKSAETDKDATPSTTKANVQLEGSWEHTYGMLAKQLSSFMVGKGLQNAYGYSYIEAMFPESAIIGVDGRETKYYRCGWGMDGTPAAPKWSGDPVEVKIAASVEEVKTAKAAANAERTEARFFAKLLAGELADGITQQIVDAAPELQKQLAERRHQTEMDELRRFVAGSP